jgi:hypothetical protein
MVQVIGDELQSTHRLGARAGAGQFGVLLDDRGPLGEIGGVRSRPSRALIVRPRW